MNDGTRVRCSVLVLGLAVAVACDGSDGSVGSVGSEECVGARTRCTVPQLTMRPEGPDTEEVSTKALPELGVSWVHPLPLMPLTAGNDGTVQLARDDQDALWLFVSRKTGIEVARLDDEGAVQHSGLVTPPEGLPVDDAATSWLYAARQTGAGLSLHVAWTVRCQGHDAVSCQPSELLRFEGDQLQPTQRTLRQEPAASDSRGNSYYFVENGGNPKNPYAVEKYDAHSRLVWRQAALETPAPRADIFGGAMFEDSQFVAFYNDGTSDDRDYVDNMFVLDEDGNIELHDQFLVTMKAHPVLLQAKSGPVLVGSGVGFSQRALFEGAVGFSADPTATTSDLWLLRQTDALGHWRGAKVLQEHFTPLRVRTAAVSRDETIYAVTTIGGRDVSEQQTAICRSPEAGPAACFLLPCTLGPELDKLSDVWQLVARERGVLYLRAGTQLVRIDMPK
jgi:hypothetical protein